MGIRMVGETERLFGLADLRVRIPVVAPAVVVAADGFEGVRLQLRQRFACGAGLVCEVRRLLVPAMAHAVCDDPGIDGRLRLRSGWRRGLGGRHVLS